MSLKNNGIAAEITCDKCKKITVAPSDEYNKIFFEGKWRLNMGTKYMHLCYSCQTPKQRKTTDFAINNFPIKDKL